MIHEFENIDGVIHHRVFPSQEELGPEGVEKIKRIASRLLPGGYVDETGPRRGVPPTQEDYDRIALVYAHRTLFKDGPIKPQVVDPLPPEGMQLYMRANHISGPYDAEFTQEMPIEEAKKRWPNTPIPGEENK